MDKKKKSPRKTMEELTKELEDRFKDLEFSEKDFDQILEMLLEVSKKSKEEKTKKKDTSKAH